MLAAATEAAEALAAEGVSVTVWDVRVVKPLDEAMVDDALEHPVVVTVEDGLPTAASARPSPTSSPPLPRRRPHDRRCWACPTAYIPHAKPDVILAQLGLDAAGIFASAVSLMAADRATGLGLTQP